MGALFFWILVFFAFIVGCTILGIGLIFLIVTVVRMAKGKRAVGFGVTTIILTATGFFIAVIPFICWLGLRWVNLSGTAGDYVKTEKFVEGGYHESSFSVDGVRYERMSVAAAPDCPMGQPVFCWDVTTPMGAFFGYYERGNYYTVDNAPGLDIVSNGSYLWCRSDLLAEAQAWYTDSANYRWYLREYSGDDETPDTLLSPQPDSEWMKALLNAQSKELPKVDFTIAWETDIPEFHLHAISNDGVADGSYVYLAIYEDRLCFPEIWNQEHTEETHTDIARPLPTDLAAYFTELLESQKPSR